MFSLQRVDDHSWPFLRGVNVLKALFEDVTIKINQTELIPGHLALLIRIEDIRDCLLVLDATPNSQLISSQYVSQIIDRVKSNADGVPSPTTNNFSLDLNNSIDSILIYHFQSPVVSLFFDVDSHNEDSVARLFVITKDSQLFLWRWDTEQYRWISSVSKFWLTVTSSISNPPNITTSSNLGVPANPKSHTSVRFGIFSSKYNRLMWYQDTDGGSIYSRTIHVPEHDSISRTSSIAPRDRKNTVNQPQANVINQGRRNLPLEFGPITKHVEALSSSGNSSSNIQFLAGKEGLWIRETTTILYWSYRTHLSDVLFLNGSKSFGTDSNPEQPESISIPLRAVIGWGLHPQTRELVLLDPTGRVFIAREPEPSDHQIQVVHLLTLQPFFTEPPIEFNQISSNGFASSTNNSELPKILVEVQSHSIACVWKIPMEEHCRFYDLRTGACLQQIRLADILFSDYSTSTLNSSMEEHFSIAPKRSDSRHGGLSAERNLSFWSSSHGRVPGFFTEQELYEIKVTDLVTYSESSIEAHTKQSTSASKEQQHKLRIEMFEAVMGLGKDWAHPGLEYKYALELFMSQESDEETKQKSAEILLRHMQNPALLVVVLSKTKSSKYIQKILEQFIQKYEKTEKPKNYNKYDLDPNDESARMAAAASFNVHTPLNEILYPKLKKLLQLCKEREQEIVAPRGENFVRDPLDEIDSLQPSEVLTVTASKLEAMSRHYPRKTLQLLEQALGVTEDSVFNIALLHEEETIGDIALQGSQPQSNSQSGKRTTVLFFEIMCQLYFNWKPAQLVNFIQNVKKAYELRLKLDGVNGNSRDHYTRALGVLFYPTPTSTHEQVEAYATILARSGQLAEAVDLLLARSSWKFAVEFLKKVLFENPASKNEIFDLNSNQSLSLEDAIASSTSLQEEQLSSPNIKTVNPIFASQHSLVFHQILSNCLKSKNYRDLELIWDLMPCNFTVYHLIQELKQNAPEELNPKILAEENGCSIALLKPIFEKLLQKERK